MSLCVFYDLFKDIGVIHYILSLGNERRNNKSLKICSNAKFKGDGKSDQTFIYEVLNERYHVQAICKV